MNLSEEDIKRIEYTHKQLRAAGASMADAADQFRRIGLSMKQCGIELKNFAAAIRDVELMQLLRDYYDLQGVDDENVDLATDGLLGRALITFQLEWKRFWKALWEGLTS